MTSTTSTARRERGDRAALTRTPGEETATAARPAAARTDFDADADHAGARREALPGLIFCLFMLGATLWVGLKFLLESPRGG